MTKQELTAVGLYAHIDGYFYTHDFEFAFQPSTQTLFRHSEVNGDLIDPVKIISLTQLQLILSLDE